MTSVISHPAKQDGFWRGCTISERRRSPTANPKAKPFSICFCNSSHYNFSTEAQPFRNASFCKIIHPQQILMARWTIFFFVVIKHVFLMIMSSLLMFCHLSLDDDDNDGFHVFLSFELFISPYIATLYHKLLWIATKTFMIFSEFMIYWWLS